MSAKLNKTACTPMHGPEKTMDQYGTGFEVKPINILPSKCSRCAFPDIDFVPKKFLLGKGSSTPTEMTSAMFGNFFVRERVRRLLELVVPGVCGFVSTVDAKTRKPLPWSLAIPQHKLKTCVPKSPSPLCPRCGEPRDWPRHQGRVWEAMKKFDSKGIDVFKTLEWDSAGIEEDDLSSPPPWTRLRLERELYFSVRMQHLLKRAKVKGQLAPFFDGTTPTAEDEEWIQAKLRLLAGKGMVDVAHTSDAKSSKAAQLWFKRFLKRKAVRGTVKVDFKSAEAKYGLALPNDYKDFITQIPSISFRNVNDIVVTDTIVLAPHKMDFKNFRRGRIPNLAGDDAQVDGVVFAEMDNGDCFVFDVSAGGNDYPVYSYRHEESLLEPFASSFAECIKRFVLGN